MKPCCDSPLIVSLDSYPPYVYCTRCKATVDCPRCGAKGTDGNCFPEECRRRQKERAFTEA